MVSHLCLAGHVACLSMPLPVGECDGWKKQKGLKVSNYDNVVVIQGIFFFFQQAQFFDEWAHYLHLCCYCSS